MPSLETLEPELNAQFIALEFQSVAQSLPLEPNLSAISFALESESDVE